MDNILEEIKRLQEGSNDNNNDVNDNNTESKKNNIKKIIVFYFTYLHWILVAFSKISLLYFGINYILENMNAPKMTYVMYGIIYIIYDIFILSIVNKINLIKK